MQLAEIWPIIVHWTRQREISGAHGRVPCLCDTSVSTPLGDLVVQCTTRKREGAQWPTVDLMLNQYNGDKDLLSNVLFPNCVFSMVLMG